ncbi:hypothetical protein ACFVY1_36400 [Streptomyces sp. NPDC058293]|uniref:hypothetical protein n=1 Tax=Streptomyces sp. NPDC058293 TaxID=3346429 RepID=UPI0036E0237E
MSSTSSCVVEERTEVEHALDDVEPAGCLRTAGNGTGIDLPFRPLTTVDPMAGYA